MHDAKISRPGRRKVTSFYLIQIERTGVLGHLRQNTVSCKATTMGCPCPRILPVRGQIRKIWQMLGGTGGTLAEVGVPVHSDLLVSTQS